MGHRLAQGSDERFAAYVEEIASVIGHADRVGPLEAYCIGLLLPSERKSVEPMAAVTAPERVSAQHQSLLHFISQGGWSDGKVLGKVREMVVPGMERHGPIEAWIIDDTGFPKQGKHSVGVARQYCGRLGKQDNCQVAVMLSLANHHASLPVAYRLYLPKEWARGVVLMDAGYGASTELRRSITALDLTYVAGILPNTTVWEEGEEPLPPKQSSGRGRPAKLLRRDAKHQPISVKELSLNLPASTWRKVTWREGVAAPLSSRFARVRVRAAHRDYKLTEPYPEEWLLVEWPKGEKEPTKYWLSTLPDDISFYRLVDCAKLRWRIEHDYKELKQEVGLGDFEGRGWRGFHHHATMSIAVYGFLISERGAFPPSASIAKVLFPELALPKGYRPRGSAAAA